MSMNKVKLHKLLTDWGIWCREGRCLRSPLGFPQTSPILRAGEGGAPTPGPRSPTYIHWDQELFDADRAIRQLPTEQRTLIQTLYVHRLSHQLAAQYLQLPKSTVAYRKNKALRQFRRMLEGRSAASR